MEKLKREVLNIAKRMYLEKMVSGSSGNVSAYSKAEDIMIITPSDVDYAIMTEKDIVTMRLDGTIVSGEDVIPSSEWRMHAVIYKKRSDVSSIVHTHSPYATGFAVLRNPIPFILVEMLPFLGGGVPVADFALPGTEELGQNSLEVLGDRNGCLLMNHGTLAIGSNLQEAYVRAVYIEDAAKIYFNALSIGEPYVLFDEIDKNLL